MARSQAEAEEICQRIYLETAAFYNEIAPALGDYDCGYKILYGSPVFRPPVFFIGYQPGGMKKEIGEEKAWPSKFEYATAEWTLAQKIRDALPTDFLHLCTGANTIFSRAPDMKTYGQMDNALAKKIELFCRNRLLEIIDALQPKRIVFVGIKAATIMEASEKILWSPKQRKLGVYGKVGNIESLAVLHLSGARMSVETRNTINEALREFVIE